MTRSPIARLPLTVALALAMAACAPADTDPGTGGVSVGEAQALDRAAEMLEDRRPAADLLAGRARTPVGTTSGAPRR